MFIVYHSLPYIGWLFPRTWIRPFILPSMWTLLLRYLRATAIQAVESTAWMPPSVSVRLPPSLTLQTGHCLRVPYFGLFFSVRSVLSCHRVRLFMSPSKRAR